jgi:hypothetical protein
MRNLALPLATIAWMATSATAALADPPMGYWTGDHGSLTFTLSNDGTYVIPGLNTGTWNWQQTGPKGGILTFHYVTHTGTQDFPNSMYFSIVFTDANTATLTDPASHMSDTIRRH